MGRTTSRFEIDMCSGPLLKNILRFVIPLALSNVLQLLFNAADIMVLGRFAGSNSLAAVGATSELNHLVISLFVGLSVGVNVMAANYRGAQKAQQLEETVHTAICTGLLGGVFLVFLGGLAARPMLSWMGTPEAVLDQSVLYMQIYFCGMPGTMLYNFGAAVLRAVGETKRPMYYLTAAGALNLVLNLVFVIVCRLDVAGVALATALSQYVSAGLVLRCLIRNDGMYRLDPRRIRIVPQRLAEMARMGVPAGLQGALFGFANVTLQSGINSFGELVVSGAAVGANLESFASMTVSAMHQACLSFVSQNRGAGNQKRIGQTLRSCMLLSIGIGLGFAALYLTCGQYLLRFYTPDPAVVEYGMVRLRSVVGPYLFYGIMEMACAAMRGLGYSLLPAMVSLGGVCITRLLWVHTVFAWYPQLWVLFLAWPVSWAVTGAIHLCCYAAARKKAVS